MMKFYASTDYFIAIDLSSGSEQKYEFSTVTYLTASPMLHIVCSVDS